MAVFPKCYSDKVFTEHLTFITLGTILIVEHKQSHLCYSEFIGTFSEGLDLKPAQQSQILLKSGTFVFL